MLPDIIKCPNCQSSLTEGYLSFLTFLKWGQDKPTKIKAYGDIVAGKKYWNVFRSTEGKKCNKCGLVMFLPDKKE